ncbi:LytS/YhcK type 5TM receptor domain-containing protein [Polynucleobacter necessarius]|uniref:LytS/YhcK type 5TM receptor domain-containing protein n=1 Tax=Polynucleobacter necessarius TaxID=576610 RepID=UPI000E09303B|nr:LytS/YhcK type 5TM receptor domain-containing protein [Polynucleobacter necessarius]HAT39455.1 hypothetical protein [Polynucleobacter sp.]
MSSRVLAGIALEIVTVISMNSPASLFQGIIFDIRLIVINAATLFCGPITGVTTAIIAAAFRLYVGGIGGDVNPIRFYHWSGISLCH